MRFSPSWPSVFATRDGRLFHYGIRELKQTVRMDGYLVCRVPFGPQVLVHRIIADAWHDRIAGRNVVNHLNGIRSDNQADNLEWCDQTRNCRHANEEGLRKRRYGKDTVVSVRNDFFCGMSAAEISKKYSIPKMTTYAILNGYIHKKDGGPIRERRENVFNGYLNAMSISESADIARRFMLGESAGKLSAEFNLSKHAILGIVSDHGGGNE